MGVGEGISCLALLGMKQDLPIFCHFNTLPTLGLWDPGAGPPVCPDFWFAQAGPDEGLFKPWVGPWAKDIGLPVTLPVEVTQTRPSGKSS